MKKTLFAALLVALTTMSCGNKTTGSPASADTTAVDSSQALTDSVVNLFNASKDEKSLSASIAAFQAKYQDLIASGKVEQAKVYAEQVKAYVTEHADEIKSTVGGNATVTKLIDGIKTMPTSATEAVNSVKSATTSKGNDLKEQAIERGNAKVNEAKENFQKKTDESVDKATKKASDAAGKAIKKIGL